MEARGGGEKIVGAGGLVVKEAIPGLGPPILHVFSLPTFAF